MPDDLTPKPNKKPQVGASGAAHPRKPKRSNSSSRTPDLAPSPEIRKIARSMFEAFTRANRIKCKKSSIEKWAKHFAAISQLDSRDPAHVLEVLTWFLDNFTHQFAPRCYSGETIRDRFFELEDAMERISPFYGVVMTEQGNDYAYRIWNFGWPGFELREQIYPAVQKSHDFVIALRARLKEAPPYPPRDPEWDGKVRALLIDHLGHDWNEVCRWWYNVNRQVAEWPQWNKKIRPYVLSLDNRDYSKDLEGIASRFLGPPACPAFQELMKGLKG